jgi:hypothetical protein
LRVPCEFIWFPCSRVWLACAGNLNTDGGDPFTLSFQPDITAFGGSSSLAAPVNAGYYDATFTSTRSGAYSMYVKLAGVTVGSGQAAAVTVLAGPAVASQSTAAGTGTVATTANTLTSFDVFLNDQYGNAITQANRFDNITGLLAGTIGGNVVRVAVSCPTSWSTKLTCTYTPQRAGTYGLFLYINGGLLAMGTSVQVSAGPVAAAFSQASGNGIDLSPNVAAGTQCSFEIQARDAQNNDRQATNDGSAVFSVDFKPAVTGYTILYNGGGKYLVTYIPITAGALRVEVNMTRTGPLVKQRIGLPKQPMTVTVVPGVADAVKTTMTWTGYPTALTGTAGATVTYRITSRDSQNNLRNQASQPSAYSVLVKQGVISIAGTVNPSVSPTPGFQEYPVTFKAFTSGSYQVFTKLTSTGADVNPASAPQSPFNVQINPAVTNGSRCVISGSGFSGGTDGDPATFTVQARDSWDNNQLGSSDQFRVRIGLTVTAAQAATPISAVANGNGLYTVTYNVPARSCAAQSCPFDLFCIIVEANIGGTGFKEIRRTTAARSLINNARSYATVEPKPLGVGKTNAPNKFFIIDRTSGGAILKGGQVFTVTICDVTNIISCIPSTQISVSPALGGPNDYNYTVTYVPPRIGVWNVTVLWQGVVRSDKTPVRLTTTFGAVNSGTSVSVPASTVAGVPGSFDVTLYDSAGQVVTTSNLAIQATLDTPPETPGQAVTVTGTWVPGVQRWRFSYTRNKAGTYAVSVFLTSNPTKNLIGSGTNIVIVPAAAAASHTLVDGPGLSAANADEVAEFDITPYDQFDNPVDDPALAAQFSCSLNSAPASPCNAAVYRPLSLGKLTGSYKTQKSLGGVSAFQLTIKLNGVTIGPVGVYNVVVQPGTISPTYSTVSGQAATVLPKSPLTFTLTCKDVFQNEWLTGTRTLRALVTPPPLFEGDVPAPLEADVTSIGGAQYTVTLDGAYTLYIGTYYWTITVDENVVNVATLAAQRVVPGPTEPANTIVEDVLPPTLSVNQTSSVRIKLFDAGLNPRIGAPQEDVQVSFLQGQAVCPDGSDVDTPPAPLPLATQFKYWVQYKQNGTYDISFIGTATGKFSINITVNGGVAMTCITMRERIVVFGPGSPYQPLSQFTPSTIDAFADENKVITVALKDRFGNPSSEFREPGLIDDKDFAPTLAKVGFQLSGGSLLSSQWNFNTSTDKAVGSQDAPRTYSITFRVRKAGTYQYAATYKGIVLGSPAGSLTVKAGAPVNPQFGAIPSPFAGEPSSLDLTALDLFGNLVTTSLHTYEVVLTPRDRTLLVGGYILHGLVKPMAGFHRVEFQSAWAGIFDVAATLIDQSGFRKARADGVITFKPATCASVDASKPFRCPDDSCAASYSACPNQQTFRCADPSPVACATQGPTLVCKATARECPCPSDAPVTCPATGQCAVTLSDCLSAPTCPEGTQQCMEAGQFTGQCRSSLADCPAPFVCTPGFFMCPNKVSCARTLDDCVSPAELPACAAGTYRCPAGDCVEKLEDCGTRKTCGASEVLCPDGSCQANADACQFQFQCYAPNPVRCADGSCRTSIEACPTPITCPVGFVLCESNQCVKTSSDCLPIADCPASSVRCPDGSCRSNIVLCPTVLSCPLDKPVLCSDGSCSTSVYLCSDPRSCPAGSTVCPDGSCITGNAQCPNGLTCPLAQPVLCPDSSCVASLASCVTIASCPVNAPVRCPSGSCRANLVDCPTTTGCPSSLPVRCLDGNCVLAADLCPPVNATSCAGATPVRCPGGECASSQSLCPTHLTCYPGSTKCMDGTCRNFCPNMTLGVDLTKCSVGFVRCPQSGFGVTCALSLAQCPQAPVCPADKPVKCMDVTCAVSVNDCPKVTGDWPPGLVACSDYTFKTSLDQCATVVTCPPAYPFKCYDDSCRKTPSDCPQPPVCPANLPFLCPNGKCVDRLWDPQCGSATVYCNGNTPVKCPTGVCAASTAKCPAIYEDNQAVQVDDGSSLCPSGWLRCRDGSCAESQEQCLPLACPSYLPVLCLDGLCTTDAAYCNYDNGCPWNKPTKCWNGLCSASASECPARTQSCPQGASFNCPDGSCAASSADCPSKQQNGCRDGQFLCLDKRCVQRPQSADDVNQCVSGSSTANTCPATRPFRCASGYCSVSNVQCPILSFKCPAETPVPCADGSCVASAFQCPSVSPCGTGVRCGDGSCRDSREACPLVNTCPMVDGRQLERCDNGMCAVGPLDQTNACIDDKTGCPANANFKCSNGACVTQASLCDALVLPSNGCPLDRKERCSNGACMANAGDCPLSNGCPRNAAFRCKDGSCLAKAEDCEVGPYNLPCPSSRVKCADESCVANANECKTLGGCPVGQPIRCGDGSCKALFSECSPVVACANSLEVLCYDGSCVSSAKLCVPRVPCPVGTTLCSDGSCKAQCSTGGQSGTGSGCPPGSPVLCSSGVCKGSLSQCPSSPVTPVPNLPTACPKTAPYQCFDGSCKASYGLCIAFSMAVAGGNPSSVESVCAAGLTLCPNGACVAKPWECGIIPACPWERPLRCWDGSCVASQDGARCPAASGSDDCSALGAQFRRCEDGVCRLQCLQYDGCGLQQPFHCANRNCAEVAEKCLAAEEFDESKALVNWVDPADAEAAAAAAAVPVPSTAEPAGNDTTGFRALSFDDKVAHPCYRNCRNQLKASPLVVSVDNTVDVTIAIAVDSARVVQAKLLVPSGAIRVRAGAPSSAKPVMTIRPVGESTMRDVVNRVTLSRRPEFRVKYLTMPWTLVSPAFECSTDALTAEPFKVPVSVVASSDRDNLPLFKDICLGYIYSVPDVNYRAWRCVEDTIEKRMNNSVRSASTNSTEAAYVVKGNLYACRSGPKSSTVFAFVVVPARDLGVFQPEVYRFWADNLIWIVLGICGGGLIIFLVFYTMKRLHRYRAKYKETDKKVAQMQEEVDEMEQFGGNAGQKDEALEMMSNPMVVQMKDMQARLDRKNQEVLQEEAKRTEEEAEARADHLAKLQEDRNNLAAELEKLKAELAASGVAKPKAVSVDTEDIELGGGVAASAGAASSGGAAASSKAAVQRAQFDAKPAGGRKKKAID